MDNKINVYEGEKIVYSLEKKEIVENSTDTTGAKNERVLKVTWKMVDREARHDQNADLD